ncbi:MAG: glycosyltransferase [gamma proteobacterium symbiont of Bathyaustriella thionipta]|nr:glycosyltransferase [gamma proteobacterium symbiont of Bathyaustriella thionipta]MCU7954276.1 glycosyltransferase [gamma proteobacterium symbiont of Bathyaustriella thionipta]MCU7957899.1 glycosyltransferase [gamma proteobacterium symbiont of Bathyaustriella thionipta]MCU7965615.1 glycosyltransferase [gamma proteobacterium symbiont of Bathyaustriella thionipta]
MKFSIITPTFNHQKYIETTILSVMNNKKGYSGIEYIIIDGASTDGTCKIVEKYKDQIDLFISETDDGQADAINKGFENATGDIFAYLNSDDYYYPETIKKVKKIFEENHDVDVVYGDCAFVTEDEQFLRYFTEVEPYNKYRLLNCSDFIMQPTCFWRKEIYTLCNGFDKTMHYGFDWDMWGRMAIAGAKFYYLKDLLAVNREFEETKTSTGGQKRLAELKKIIGQNKMGFYASAYSSYVAAELKKNSGIRERLIFLFHKIMALENTIYNYQNIGEKHLYGTLHKSNKLSQVSRLSIPNYNGNTLLDLEFSIPKELSEQQLLLVINHKTYNIKQKNQVIKLTVKIPDVHMKRVDVDLKFSHTTTKDSSLLHRILGQTKPYSARLIDFSMSKG